MIRYYLCYQLEDKELMIDSKIEELFRKNHNAPSHTMVSQDTKEVKGYDVSDVIGSLKLGPLQWIATSKIITIVMDGLDKGIVEEERELSDFDKLILKALNYNPKKK